MVAHTHHHGFGMCLEAGQIFVGIHPILQHQKLHVGLNGSEQRHGMIREYGIHVVLVGQTAIGVEVNDIPLPRPALLRQLLPHIHIVGAHVGIVVTPGQGILLPSTGHDRCDDHRHLSAADVQHRACLPAFGLHPIEVGTCPGRYRCVSTSLADIFHQMSGHGDFGFRFLAQRHTDGVADAIGQQCADAHGTLYPAVLALAGLGHAQVQRIVHALALHRGHQQAHRLHHHHRVAGLDGDDHVVEVFSSADAQKLHAALHDSLRRVAIAAHDAVGERPVVHADAYGGAMLAADVEKRHQLSFYLLQFTGIFLIGIFQLFELPCRVNIVAGIDSHLLGIEGGHVGHMRIEMHVGHQGCGISPLPQQCIDVLQVLRLAHALCGEAHIFASCLDDAYGLLHAALGIVGRSGGHRLHPDGMFAAQRSVAHLHDRRGSPLVAEQVDVVCFHVSSLSKYISLRPVLGWPSRFSCPVRPCIRPVAAPPAHRSGLSFPWPIWRHSSHR